MWRYKIWRACLWVCSIPRVISDHRSEGLTCKWEFGMPVPRQREGESKSLLTSCKTRRCAVEILDRIKAKLFLNRKLSSKMTIWFFLASVTCFWSQSLFPVAVRCSVENILPRGHRLGLGGNAGAGSSLAFLIFPFHVLFYLLSTDSLYTWLHLPQRSPYE